MDNTVFSVGEFVALVNQTLEFAYPQVAIEGEVSSFNLWKERFIYFDLKDEVEDVTVNCFMMPWQLKFPIEDGMKVRVKAVPKLTNKGKFSLTVQDVAPVGEGSLKKAFELLRAKLSKEGLFDESRKRPLPTYPTHIGVISSAQAAGYGDFIKITDSRWGGLTISLADVQVQGEAAANQIVNALEYFNQHSDPPEVLVIIRGGGSLEDLQVFNTEPVVRAIAGSRTPTIVGVGHENDISLSDLAADVRAATPSHAAQIVVPDRQEVLSLIDHRQQQLLSALEKPALRVEELASQLQGSMDDLNKRLNHEIDTFMQLLNSYHPKSVLQRGYSITRDENGKIVRDAGRVHKRQKLMVELQRGKLTTEVINVQND